jgi:hypothetical protein
VIVIDGFTVSALDDRTVGDEQARVAPDLAAIVDHAGVGAIAHGAAAERMGGEQAAQRPVPEQAAQVVAAQPGAQLLESLFHLLEHLHARGRVPVEIDVAVAVELEHAVGCVAAHAEERQEVLGAVTG